MLEYLHVKNLALLEECELEFNKGLNVLTGETGAGKSVLLGSVNLALGAHGDKDLIRTGCEEAFVELGFSVDKEIRSLLSEMEISCDDDTVYISRKFTATKNVFKINGETVTAKQVKKLAGGLIDIHGQHEHQSLLSTDRQLNMLDAYGGEEIIKLLKKTKEAAEEYSELLKALKEAESQNQDRSREISLLQYEVDTITNASLKPSEDEELEAEYKRMQASEKLLSLTKETLDYVSSDQGENVGSLLSRAISNMRRVSSIDEAASELENKLIVAEEYIGDFTLELSRYMDKLDFSEEEFSKVEERLNIINSLKSRFGRTIEDILAYCEEKTKELDRLTNFEDYLSGLRVKLEQARCEYDKQASLLTKARLTASKDFSDRLSKELVSLSFNNAQFEARVTTEDVVSSKGMDSIEFMISTNLGEPLKPMKNVASGGELSRIMLAIKTILASKDEIDALIFDEIDTGISGRTAWGVAEKLAGLSKEHQVILITHLAQIAAMGDVHYAISKHEENQKTYTTIDRLDEEGSVMELARLLGSDEPGEATLINAKELKAKANEYKKNS